MKIVYETDSKNVVYRIPVVCKTKNNTLLAFCEKRYDGISDTGKIDVVVKKSSDNGNTWSKEQTIVTDNKNTFGNPCPIVGKDGIIHLLTTWNDGDIDENSILKGESKRVPYYCRSEDNGNSWSKSKKIEGNIADDNWYWYATGPNIGIEVNDRLIAPCNHSTYNNKKAIYRAHLLYSDDNGITWNKSDSHDINTNESGVIEFDGKIIQIMRIQNKTKRWFGISSDNGETFNDNYVGNFQTAICQSGVLKCGDLVLVSAPLSNNRENLTINFSKNLKEWYKKSIYLGPSAYSSLVQLNDKEIGIFYERDNYSKLCFDVISIKSLYETEKPKHKWSFIKKYYDDNGEKKKRNIEFNESICLYFDHVSELWDDQCLDIIVSIDNVNFIVNFDKMKMYSLRKDFRIETDRNRSIKLKLNKEYV